MIVREQRPDKSDFQSFPSDTAALAFAPAQFLWDRYGWEYGVPAYLAAGFVGYSRVDAKKHHWYDVAASAGMSFALQQDLRHANTAIREFPILSAPRRTASMRLNYHF